MHLGIDQERKKQYNSMNTFIIRIKITNICLIDGRFISYRDKHEEKLNSGLFKKKHRNFPYISC